MATVGKSYYQEREAGQGEFEQLTGRTLNDNNSGVGGEGQAASSISFEQKTLNKKIYIEVTAEAIAI